MTCYQLLAGSAHGINCGIEPSFILPTPHIVYVGVRLLSCYQFGEGSYAPSSFVGLKLFEIIIVGFERCSYHSFCVGTCFRLHFEICFIISIWGFNVLRIIKFGLEAALWP